MKLPAIQFYPGDWRKDPGVQALSFEERGIWLEILFLMHESTERGKLLLNGKKIPTNRLAKMLGVEPDKMADVMATIIELGVADIDPDTGALVNRRMVRDDAFIKQRRECGKLGGNPKLTEKVNPDLNQEVKVDDKVTPKLQPTPSSSTSSSASTIESPPLAREGSQRPILPTLDQTKAFAPSAGVDPRAAECWFLDCESRGVSINGYFIDAKGAEIRNWQSAMTSYGRKWQSNDEKDAQRHKKNGPNSQPPTNRNVGHNANVSYANRPAHPPTPNGET